MKVSDFTDGYELFDRFINELLLNHKSLITKTDDIDLETGVAKCYDLYVRNPIPGGMSFDDKIEKQFDGADYNTLLIFAHSMWLWSFAVMDIKPEKKKSYSVKLLNLNSEVSADLEEVYPKGFGSGGERHTRNKFDEVKFSFLIIKYLHEAIKEGELNEVEEVKERIEQVCLYKKYGIEFEGLNPENSFFKDYSDEQLAMPNIMLHMAKPEQYERIASNKDKRLICNSFSSLLNKEEQGYNKDEKLYRIREALSDHLGNDIDFYNWSLKKVWNYSSIEKEFDEIQGLEYKKAIILYGPPGTSKTFSAKQIAETLITKKFLGEKDNVRKFVESFDKSTDEIPYLEDRIHYLQLHPSYTYEDFVAGMQLRKNETKAVEGKIFDICEEAKDDKYPHVLILDEINRVDLSQLFGEVFSALENRGEDIEVGVGDFKLNIPENLYVIGTMNEIDFSLERIDFALRRRFLWHNYGFDAGRLKSIIDIKQKKYHADLGESQVDRFIHNVKQLNKDISDMQELGSQYEIGHTFFAEVVDIYNSYKELNSYTSRIKDKIFRSDGPAEILWDISIEPMLKSFLGTVNPDTMKEKVKNLKDVFLK